MAKANGLAVWPISVLNGPCTGANPDAEASLDEQYMGAIGYGNNQTYWTDADWMYDWARKFLWPLAAAAAAAARCATAAARPPVAQRR